MNRDLLVEGRVKVGPTADKVSFGGRTLHSLIYSRKDTNGTDTAWHCNRPVHRMRASLGLICTSFSVAFGLPTARLRDTSRRHPYSRALQIQSTASGSIIWPSLSVSRSSSIPTIQTFISCAVACTLPFRTVRNILSLHAPTSHIPIVLIQQWPFTPFHSLPCKFCSGELQSFCHLVAICRVIPDS